MLLGVRPWGYSREQDRQVILFQKPLSRDGGSHVANQVLRAPREAAGSRRRRQSLKRSRKASQRRVSGRVSAGTS